MERWYANAPGGVSLRWRRSCPQLDDSAATIRDHVAFWRGVEVEAQDRLLAAVPQG
jgi:hypothetical protein